MRERHPGAAVERQDQGRFDPFRHVTAEQAPRYRAVMRAFVEAKQRFLVHLRPEDVLAALSAGAADLDEVNAGLAQLSQWGNLRQHPDTGRVVTVEDFNRARFLYQLTPAGEAAERALATYDEALGRRAELQVVALADIRDALAALRVLAVDPAPDPAKAHSLLRDLSGVFDGLADNAQAFMGSLQRTIDLHDVELEAFLAYKEQLLGYVERFVGDLTTASADIAATLTGLDADPLLLLAAQREASDAAPGSEGDVVAARLRAWRDRWRGLRAWFVSDRARPSQASLLRKRARTAIADLLGVVTRLNERRAGRSDRSADFRTLALWFAQAPTAVDAHRLWRVAFGLAPARHLTIDAATMEVRELDPVRPGTAWEDAPPVQISPRLRATGTSHKRGSVPRVVDRGEERRLLAARLAEESAQTEAARRRLATGRPVRLSEIGPLDPTEFALFLSLLGDALAVQRGGATATTTTGDGSLRVTLTPLADGRIAEVCTPAGTFRGADHLLEITDLLVDLPELVHR